MRASLLLPSARPRRGAAVDTLLPGRVREGGQRRWVRGIVIGTRLRLGRIPAWKDDSGVQMPTWLGRPQRRWLSSKTPQGRPRTAIFFPGQGVQKVGMLTPWLEAFPRTTGRLLDEVDSLMGCKLSTIMAEGPSKVLSATPMAQPAIMATSVIVLRILEQEYGFQTHDRADVALGHSLGEFAALVCADHLEFADGLHLVRRRAEVMRQATSDATAGHGGEYGMVAVVVESPRHLAPLVQSIEEFVGRCGTREDDARADIPPIDQVLIANVNSKNQIVLSGSIERIKTLVAHVRQFLGSDPRMVRLNADSPFHSPIMKPAVKAMEELLSQPSRVPRREGDGRGGEIDVIKWPGKLQCISNVTARPFESRAQLKDLLARQCLETVRWWDSIKYLDQEQRVRRWIGIGPGKVGRNLVGKEVGMRGMDVVKGGGVWGITEPAEVEEVLRGLEQTEGFGVDEYADYE